MHRALPCALALACAPAAAPPPATGHVPEASVSRTGPRSHVPANTPAPPLSPQAARALVDAALKEGREATARGEHTAAIAVFERALAAVPRHAGALAGRGHARLLAGQLDAAGDDLSAARTLAAEPGLQAAIDLDLGLLHDKRGETEAALQAFHESQRLRPSEAAAARLREASCDGVDRVEVAATRMDGWRALADVLGPLAEPPLAVADDAAARLALCGEAACGGAAPWFVAVAGGAALVEPDDDHLRTFVILRPGIPLVNGSCAAAVARPEGPALRVTTVLGCEIRQAFNRCEVPGEGPEDCWDVQWNAERTREDLFFAAAPLRRILRITRTGNIPDGVLADLGDTGYASTLAVTEAHVALADKDCSLRFPLPR